MNASPQSQSGAPCRVCGAHDFGTLLDFGQQPIAHRLLASADAEEERFRLHIEICRRCGLGQVRSPIDPTTLYRGYNYCFSSWKPEPHMPRELDLIVSRTRASTVFEIGCNDGRFLAELRERGATLGVGLEPNPYAADLARQRGFAVYETFLTESACDEVLDAHGRFDLVVARQVLEHLQDIGLFFRCTERLLADGGHLFIDLPNIVPSLEAGDCTIAWEEHVNYFTPATLAYALASNGFEPVETVTYNFSGGAQAVLARRAGPSRHTRLPEVDTTLIEQFPSRVAAYRERLVAALSAERRAGVPIVLYGVGCRACAAVNGLDLATLIDFAVDDQQERQGKYMPGSRLEIRSSNAIPSGALVLLAVNQENESKVEAQLRTRASLSGLRLLSLLGPDDVTRALDVLTEPRTSS